MKIEYIGRLYYEYKDNGVGFHDYFNIMIDNFPIITIRKIDNPHSENDNMDKVIMIGILGFIIR